MRNISVYFLGRKKTREKRKDDCKRIKRIKSKAESSSESSKRSIIRGDVLNFLLKKEFSWSWRAVASVSLLCIISFNNLCYFLTVDSKKRERRSSHSRAKRIPCNYIGLSEKEILSVCSLGHT